MRALSARLFPFTNWAPARSVQRTASAHLDMRSLWVKPTGVSATDWTGDFRDRFSRWADLPQRLVDAARDKLPIWIAEESKKRDKIASDLETLKLKTDEAKIQKLRAAFSKSEEEIGKRLNQLGGTVVTVLRDVAALGLRSDEGIVPKKVEDVSPTSFAAEVIKTFKPTEDQREWLLTALFKSDKLTLADWKSLLAATVEGFAASRLLGESDVVLSDQGDYEGYIAELEFLIAGCSGAAFRGRDASNTSTLSRLVALQWKKAIVEAADEALGGKDSEAKKHAGFWSNRLNDLLTDIEEKNLRRRMLHVNSCLLYTSPSPRDQRGSRMPSSA